MKRLHISLLDLAERSNLLLASHKALRGAAPAERAARRWRNALDSNLATLAAGILQETVPQGGLHRFVIHDPKRREIAAPSFADRVLHHAILNLAEARFEQALVPTSFACRPGFGVHAAVAHLQRCLQRAPCWLQVDVQHCFASINHAHLLALLARRFKGAAFLRLLQRIVVAGSPAATSGLPIGALTSQHFANAYLDEADRWLLAQPAVQGHVRYMDDIVCTCASPAQARVLEAGLRQHLLASRGLALKSPARVGHSRHGLQFCGFRVKPGLVLPSARKWRRYRQGADALHAAASKGWVDEAQAQRASDTLQATLAHTCSQRRRQAVWQRLQAAAASRRYSAPL